MKFKIYFSIFLICIITVGLSFYNISNNIKFLTNKKAEELHKIRIQEYYVMLNDKKNFLNSFAKFISSSPIVIDAYLKNNRNELINFVMPLYKNLHKNNLIEEIHFFKRPAVSFVNFANLKAFNMDVSKARADIVWVSSSFSPSTHFYVCRLYPGLRATYPIIYKNRLLGSVSFGININVFSKLFKELGVNDVTIYLNNQILQNSLKPDKYAFFKKLHTYQQYKVLGNIYNIKLSPGFEIHKGYVFTKIEIKDFFHKTMAYLVIKDDISKSINIIKKRALKSMVFIIINYLFILIVVFLLFNLNGYLIN